MNQKVDMTLPLRVLERAVFDLCLTNERERVEAAEWIASMSFIEMCQMLQINHSVLRRDILTMVSMPVKSRRAMADGISGKLWSNQYSSNS